MMGMVDRMFRIEDEVARASSNPALAILNLITLLEEDTIKKIPREVLGKINFEDFDDEVFECFDDLIRDYETSNDDIVILGAIVEILLHN